MAGPLTSYFIILTTTVAVVLLLALGLQMIGPRHLSRWRGRRGENLVNRALVGSYPLLSDVILPHNESLTQVDHVVRLPGALVVVETKTFSGVITGTPSAKTWTQKLGGKSFDFRNPILQNEKHVAAVEAIADPDIDVINLVVFAGDATLPAGLPANVVTLADLPGRLQVLVFETGSADRTGPSWERLTKTAGEHASRRGEFLRSVRRAAARID